MKPSEATREWQGSPEAAASPAQEDKEEGHKGQEGTERHKDAAHFPAGQTKGSPILAGHSGTTRDLPVSKIDRAAHQKTAVPMTGEGDCPRPRQNEHAVPEWGHYGPTRGLGGIPSQSP